MGSKVGFQKRGSVSTKTRKEIDEHEIELPPESLATSIADGTVQNVVKEDATSIPVSSSAVRITQDTVEPVKINKSTRKKGEKRKHQQNDQVDVQSEEMLKLRAALQGKLRSNGVFGSTVSKSDKAQKRHKLAKRRKIELKVFAGAGVKSEEDGRNETEVFESQGSEDEFYKQVKQKKEAKRAAKAEIYSRESSSNLLLLPESVEGKRLISKEDKYTDKVKRRGGQVREIRKPSGPYGGEGLGNHHPTCYYYQKVWKENDKYTDKVKRRGGQVREIRKPSGPYGGEGLGINPNISHSIRIKN
ncbi:hypothetical protein F2Q68_00028355 [Brassica cretica]|uniref:Sas10 C-terminal domain-containing protein n=1 Tax=Brassica cretica TaxID=69181 RepID=A0A8S9I8G1_BRACR|nr:hypothetical protein F2Q68_00028355 [Brassica cretica]